ncbi:histidine phosphatase family protein [Acetobacteraceae bacterium KSS8]|uniref:Histidine phosphatase family protein n=1 Tax=Endosaccharibacter trunci TaxID=2812733 RepID=A0ABT1W5D7_9PROT|nr:histidine phosphatase family protein [Acetobacteraceae bacterium KSS8]
MSSTPPLRQLLLLRHAKATASDPGPAGDNNDHARDLAERGRHDASSMGRILRRQSLRPDMALVSSSRRTVRTWEMLGRFDDPQPAVLVSDRLYLAEPPELLSAIRDVPDTVQTLLVIGHNPGLHQLALQLAGEAAPSSLRAGLSTSTMVRLAVESGWAALGEATLAVLEQIRP